MSSKKPTCSHCGKPLKYQDCFACDGKGYERGLTFLKKECAICHGKGQLWRCEDEFKHIVEDFKAAHTDENIAPRQPSKRRHTTSAEEMPDWEPTALHPIHPENPWHLHLNIDSPLLPKSSRHRATLNNVIDRHAIKK